jgi:predicted alpha/beta hydrolase family esterase
VSGEPVKLVVPGLGGSGPGHWQSLWAEGRPGWARLEQRDWDEPRLDEWRTALEEAVCAVDGRVVLVAHSLGSLLVAHWARGGTWQRVVGALLVAPADVDAASRGTSLRAFAPVPVERLPFPSWVVASSDDPYCAFERARSFAVAWGARFLSAGAAGHLNVASGHGPWRQGKHLLQQVVAAESNGWRARRAG